MNFQTFDVTTLHDDEPRLCVIDAGGTHLVTAPRSVLIALAKYLLNPPGGESLRTAPPTDPDAAWLVAPLFSADPAAQAQTPSRPLPGR